MTIAAEDPRFVVLAAPTDQPHGMREMTLATPDGHRLVIGQACDPTGANAK
ncbi:VOC family protein [Paraburkholderia acidipaludis]|uniref:hypothetical protein n=1 Tax=Paraburkholderia acidipaludis TaxID=660537 RepID=UPI000B169B21|nr:hypothetical protein [Paraburkholderia acidipaludis]